MTIRRFLWFVVLPAVLLFAVFPFHLNGSINAHDEGVWMAAAQAMLEGKRLYRDIWLQYNPVLPWLIEAALRMLHPTLAVERGTIWSLNALALLSVTAAVPRFVRSDWLRLPLIFFIWMVPAAAFTQMIPMAARYGVGFLPLLFWPTENTPDEKRTRGSGWWAGILAGAAFWIAQEVGVAVLIAGAAVFAFDRRERRELVRYGLGAFLILMSGLWFVTVRYGLSFYLESTVFQIATLVNAERLPLPTISLALVSRCWQGQASWTLFWESLAEALAFFLPILCYVSTLAWSVLGRDRFKGGKRVAAGLAIYGLLAACSAWGRTDRWHIYFSLTPALFLSAYLADYAWRRREKAGNLLVFLFLLSGALITLPPYMGEQVRQRQYKTNQRATSVVRAGGVQLPFWQANSYEALVTWIQSHVRPGEPVLFFPYNGAIYFLADRPNPTRLPVLAYAVRRDMQEGAIREIESARVRWVIWDTDNKDFDGIPIQRFLSYLWDYLQTHYAARERLGPFVFMERLS